MMKIFIQQNRLSILAGIVLSILMILVFNSQEEFSNRFQFITGAALALLSGISLLPKKKGIAISVVTLVLLSLMHSFF